MPDNPIRVKVTVKFFTAAIAAPAKEKDDNGGGNGSNASSNSTNNRTSVAAFRTRWASRYNDNCRLKGGSDYQAIGFRWSEKKMSGG
jgi:hypothetical protein